MASPLSPAHLAQIDREEAHYNEILDGLIGTTRGLDADNSGVPTVAQLTTVLVNCLPDHRKLSALAAVAIVRLARSGDGGQP